MDCIADWLIVVFQGVIAIGLWLFYKYYFPSYMKEKGKNLATKEDIQEITRKTEEVQQEFKENFELFSSDVRFKYDFYYKQYSELYSKLYAIVMQSEYIRRYIRLTKNEDYSFENVPFIEIQKPRKIQQSMRFNEKEGPTMIVKTENVETAISQFNKIQLCEYIIEKGEFASQKLLKLAVAYRFAYNRYDGNPDNIAPMEDSAIANKEELQLVTQIVDCIVKEYNMFRKELNMEYDELELEQGVSSVVIE